MADKFHKYSINPNTVRTELHNKLNLTGTEISCNSLPGGSAVPFVHKHKENEEVYLIIQGSGEFYIDGEKIPVTAGDCIRIDPPCERCIKAAEEGISYFCVQAKTNSLEHYTASDCVMCPETHAF